MANSLLWVMWSDPQVFWGRKQEQMSGTWEDWLPRTQRKHQAAASHLTSSTHSSGLHAHAVLSTQKHESVRVFLPVRSLARSGWFMRQWLANLTHSNLIGTWMSLNLFLIKETDVNVGDFKRWLVHEHSSKKTASHVGTQHTSTSSLYITLCHMTPAKPSHIFWTRSKIQVYWGRISLTLSQIN